MSRSEIGTSFSKVDPKLYPKIQPRIFSGSPARLRLSKNSKSKRGMTTDMLIFMPILPIYMYMDEVSRS